jgi:hypothetical protein
VQLIKTRTHPLIEDGKPSVDNHVSTHSSLAVCAQLQYIRSAVLRTLGHTIHNPEQRILLVM